MPAARSSAGSSRQRPATALPGAAAVRPAATAAATSPADRLPLNLSGATTMRKAFSWMVDSWDVGPPAGSRRELASDGGTAPFQGPALSLRRAGRKGVLPPFSIQGLQVGGVQRQ